MNRSISPTLRENRIRRGLKSEIGYVYSIRNHDGSDFTLIDYDLCCADRDIHAIREEMYMMYMGVIFQEQSRKLTKKYGVR